MQALAELAVARLALHATLGILDPQAVAGDSATITAGASSGIAGRE